jgi:hypothetical protein
MRNSAAGIANTTYHIWAVRTAASATADIYAHTSATAATVLTALQAEIGGSSYAYLRHIGSIVRASAAIIQFIQTGDIFKIKTVIASSVRTNPGTSATTEVLSNVPTGVIMEVWGTAALDNVTTSQVLFRVSSLSEDDLSPAVAPTQHSGGNATGVYAAPWRGLTDASASIRSRFNASGSADVLRFYAEGYVHPRGKNG